jgi:hypothetical protein
VQVSRAVSGIGDFVIHAVAWQFFYVEGASAVEPRDRRLLINPFARTSDVKVRHDRKEIVSEDPFAR